MQILFIHQNIPGQFRHLISYLTQRPGMDVWALGEAKRVADNWRRPIPHLKLYGYAFDEKAESLSIPHLKTTEVNVRRGLAVAKSLETLKTKGLKPDVIYGHPGWGEMLFVRDAFPEARIVNYCEFYFNSEGQDLGFDPEFPERQSLRYDVRAQNMTQTQSFVSADIGISPMHWQKSRYPDLLQSKIEVIFDGIDCNVVRPNPEATFALGAGKPILTTRDTVITFVNRNLEPHRGFHVFMRALPKIQKRNPLAHVVIVGGDATSYSRPLSSGTYRELYSKEIDGKVDWSRIHFVGRIPYQNYLNLLQVSTAHVYLSYPFVLSWSLMEALAAGCFVIASRTPAVEEVIRHGETGLLVDFFDIDDLVSSISTACIANSIIGKAIRRAARDLVSCTYELKKISLPAQLRLLQG
jgi:glycosyltransferase involved in cell wall biosynthesis